MPEEEICTQELWGSFATYLSEIYVIAAGKKNVGKTYLPSTAVLVWGGLLDQLKLKLSKSTSAQTKARLAQHASMHALSVAPARACRLPVPERC